MDCVFSRHDELVHRAVRECDRRIRQRPKYQHSNEALYTSYHDCAETPDQADQSQRTMRSR